MKKFIYLLAAFVMLATACKQKGGEKGELPQSSSSVECIPVKINYVDHTNRDAEYTNFYVINDNYITEKRVVYPDGLLYEYKYQYADQANGLLNKIDVYRNGNKVGEIQYELSGQLVASKSFYADVNGTTEKAWEVQYTYNAQNQVIEAVTTDYDIWNQGANQTTKKVVYTYAGDNVQTAQYYDLTSGTPVLEKTVEYLE